MFYENVSLKQKITLCLFLTPVCPHLQGTVYNFWLTFPLPSPSQKDPEKAARMIKSMKQFRYNF